MKVQQKTSMNSPAFSLKSKIYRAAWSFIYYLLFRYSPIPLFAYRRFVLKCFGAKVGESVNIYPSAKIWWPGNLSIANDSSIGPNVNVYNQGHIKIGQGSIISQGAHLCASTHDHNCQLHPLKLAPITIGDNVWVCADAFVGPYANVGNGCVIGARAALFSSTQPWSIYQGNPAKKIKERENFE